MVHQMAQEGALWFTVMIRFGPHRRNRKITWANIVNAVLDVGSKVTMFNVVRAVNKYIG